MGGGETCNPHADSYKRGVSAKMANLRGGLKVAPTLISTRRVVSAKMVNLRGGSEKVKIVPYTCHYIWFNYQGHMH